MRDYDLKEKYLGFKLTRFGFVIVNFVNFTVFRIT